MVASYAASFLERALTVKDRAPGGAPTLRVGRARLQPHLQGLFGQLFTILGKTDESFENECVKRGTQKLFISDSSILILSLVLSLSCAPWLSLF